MKCEILTPVLTVFDDSGKIDYDGNSKMIEFLIENNVDGIVPLGSTGEFPSISFEEKKDFLDFYIEKVNKRVKILAGTGCLNYEETVDLSNFAIEKGADGVLVMSPYYFGMSQEEGYRYFDRLAKDIKGDVYIYNFGARSGFDMSSDILVRLVQNNKNIVGMKDTTVSIEHTKECLEKVLKVNPEFKMYSGFDNQLLPNAISGGVGCISALSNIFPDIWSKWIKAVNEKNYEDIIVLSNKIQDLMKLYSYKSNFSVLFKHLMHERGVNINTTSLFPFDYISDEDINSARSIVKKYI